VPGSPSPAVGLPRRLAAGLYDTLLVIALAAVITFGLVIARGEAIPPGSAAYRIMLLMVTAGYFVGFWAGAGQTPGMRTWRLRLETRTGEPAGWTAALLRFVAALGSLAPAGLGFLWALLDPGGLAWHDRISATRLVVVPRDDRMGR